jgi:hypothetical protein
MSGLDLVLLPDDIRSSMFVVVALDAVLSFAIDRLLRAAFSFMSGTKLKALR